jgi:hypothetical protein
MKKFAFAVMMPLGFFLLTGCNENKPAPTPIKNEQAQRAAVAANSITFRENSEIDNIRRRLELTSNPQQLGYIILLNEMGQPIIYESVRGKVTSGGKRLTPPDRVLRHDTGPAFAFTVNQAPSDEGTFGSSGEYIFYWTMNGEYRQWNGKYIYSDQPMRLRVEPLVVNVETTKQ